MFDAFSVTIQYHFFLAFALIISFIAVSILRGLLRNRTLFGHDGHLEWLAILLLLAVYVFSSMAD